ncbi:MAG: hypothetical protein QME42_02915 [bacterium]|nr:hypothetical protein [bacterium]
MKEEVNSILVIRSTPLGRTFNAINKLRDEYSNAKIILLVQKEVKEEIEKSGFMGEIIVGMKRGKVSLFKHLSLIAELRKKMFDLVVIIYNIEDISFYDNLRKFALAIKTKKCVGITIENLIIPFSLKEVLFRDIILKLILRLLIFPILVIIVTSLAFLFILYKIKRVFRGFKKIVLT